MSAEQEEPIPSPRRYTISTIYGARTRKPLIRVEAPELDMQMSPDDARRLGMNLIRAAEAATSDALLMQWVATLGAPPEVAATILHQWREMRAEMESDEV